MFMRAKWKHQFVDCMLTKRPIFFNSHKELWFLFWKFKKIQRFFGKHKKLWTFGYLTKWWGFWETYSWSQWSFKTLTFHWNVFKLYCVYKKVPRVYNWIQFETCDGLIHANTTTKGVLVHQVISLDFEWIHWFNEQGLVNYTHIL
jgi:hypothetical protein